MKIGVVNPVKTKFTRQSRKANPAIKISFNGRFLPRDSQIKTPNPKYHKGCWSWLMLGTSFSSGTAKNVKWANIAMLDKTSIGLV
tara:strand:- start:4603 stop:4857 length:255 start_codon:yes stop_codon:yes gene_type:complete